MHFGLPEVLARMAVQAENGLGLLIDVRGGEKDALPTTLGDPWPRPGNGVFHKIPSVSLQWIGGFWLDTAMPSRVGPRQAGQSVAGLMAE